MGGSVVGVLPVAGPADHQAAAIRCVVERHRRVVVPPVVEPIEGGQVGGVRQPLGHERLPVEIPDEVLRAGTARDRAGVETHHQNPTGLTGFPDGEREEVGAFPDSPDGVGGSEMGLPAPVDEVVGGVDDHAELGRLDGDHHPVAVVAAVPEHLRVAEFRGSDVQHGVARVPGPGGSAVDAVGQRLRLGGGAVGKRRAGAGVDRDQGRLAGGCESRGIAHIGDSAAREDHLVGGGGDGDGLLDPGHQVGGGGVPPGDVPPGGAERIVLKEEVIDAVVVQQPVGVVQPGVRRGEVGDRARGGRYGVLRSKGGVGAGGRHECS